MNNECDIVKDLLFSYNDGVLSSASMEFVEKHLRTCESCRHTLSEIRQESEKVVNTKEIDALKGVRKKINRKNVIIFTSLIVLALIIAFNVLVFVNYNNVASTMEVFLDDDITEEHLENIKNAIYESEKEADITYVSKDDALKEVQSWGRDESEFMNFEAEFNPMKASLRIKANKNDIQAIADTIQDMPGVANISTNLSSNPYLLYIVEMMQ